MRVASGWLLQGVRVGLATSAAVPVGVLIIWLMPSLLLGYPLFLLPLLLAGPLAVAGPARRSLSVAALGGVVSSVVAVASLVFGCRVLGVGIWMLNSQASM